MKHFGLAAFASMLFACGGDKLVRVDVTWPEDQVAVLVVTGPDGSPLGPGPRILETTGLTKLDVETELDFRVHVVTFAKEENGGPDLDGCGLTIRGEGQRLLEYISGYYTANVDGGESADVQLATTAIDTAASLGLSYVEKTCAVGYPCELVRTQTINQSFTGTFAQLVEAIDRDRAVALMQIAEGQPVHLMLIDGTRAERIAEISDYGVGTSIAYDYDGQVWVTTESGWVLSYALDGALTSTLSQGGIDRPLKVVASADKTVAIYGDNGVDVLVPGNMSPAQIDALEASDQLDVEYMHIFTSTRALAVANAGLHYFDGSAWTLERENAPVTFEEFSAITIDDEVAYVAGKNEDVYRRNETDGTWSKVQPHDSPAPASLRGVVNLGDGAFMVAGDAGYIGIHQNGVWCTVNTGTTNALDDLAITRDRRTAYVVGRASVQTQNKPVLMRLDLVR